MARLLIATLLLAGCAATSTLMGVTEPPIEQIRVGDGRQKVEQIVGKSRWRPGTTNGLTYDIYEYKQAQPARPGLGTAAIVLDVFTFGLTEWMIQDAVRFAATKQLAVGYDESDVVRSVSGPWEIPAGVVDICRRMRELYPSDSGFPASAQPTTTAGQEATLEIEPRITAAIEGRAVVGGVIRLPPGPHAIQYSSTRSGSIMYGATVLAYESVAAVDLLPGRTYRLRHQRVYGAQTRADLFWIEDLDSAEVLHCSWPRRG